jgi:hypothetical protein
MDESLLHSMVIDRDELDLTDAVDLSFMEGTRSSCMGDVETVAAQFIDEDLLLLDSVKYLVERERGALKGSLENTQGELNQLRQHCASLESTVKEYKSKEEVKRQFSLRPTSRSPNDNPSHRQLLLLATDGEGHRLRGGARKGAPAHAIRAQRSLLSLQTLKLANVLFSQPDLRRLCRQLQWLPSITAVDLSHNNIDDSASEDLATFFGQQLRSINLSSNELGRSAASIITQNLSQNKYLEMLDVADNPFNHMSKVGAAFRDALKVGVINAHPRFILLTKRLLLEQHYFVAAIVERSGLHWWSSGH